MYDLFCETHPHRKLNSKGKCRTCQQSASQNKIQYKPRPLTNALQKAKAYYLPPNPVEKEITPMSETKPLEQQLQDERNRIKQSLKTNKDYQKLKNDIDVFTEVYNQTENHAIALMIEERNKK